METTRPFASGVFTWAPLEAAAVASDEDKINTDSATHDHFNMSTSINMLNDTSTLTHSRIDSN
jgi:hypothetical protein